LSELDPRPKFYNIIRASTIYDLYKVYKARVILHLKTSYVELTKKRT